MVKVSEYLKRFVRGVDRRLQHCGSCMGIIIPKVVLEAFGLSEDNREVKLYMTREGILICPKQPSP